MRISTLVKQGVAWLDMKFGATLPSITHWAHRWNCMHRSTIHVNVYWSISESYGPETVRPPPSVISCFFLQHEQRFRACVYKVNANNKCLNASANPVTQPPKDMIYCLECNPFSKDFLLTTSIELSLYDCIVFTNWFADIFVHYIFETRSSPQR